MPWLLILFILQHISTYYYISRVLHCKDISTYYYISRVLHCKDISTYYYIGRVLHCKDYYEVLRVSRGATNVEMKKQYKKLALILHPDKNRAPQSEEAFKGWSLSHHINNVTEYF